MDVLKKVPVREQDPKVRATNFEEVCLGYNKEEAMEAASRFRMAILKRQRRSSPSLPHFLQSADVYVHRRVSVRDSVYVV